MLFPDNNKALKAFPGVFELKPTLPCFADYPMGQLPAIIIDHFLCRIFRGVFCNEDAEFPVHGIGIEFEPGGAIFAVVLNRSGVDRNAQMFWVWACLLPDPHGTERRLNPDRLPPAGSGCVDMHMVNEKPGRKEHSGASERSEDDDPDQDRSKHAAGLLGFAVHLFLFDCTRLSERKFQKNFEGYRQA